METPDVVTDFEVLELYNRKKRCECGQDLQDVERYEKRWSERTGIECIICPECDNEFLIRDGTALPPDNFVVIEKNDGIYQLDKEGASVFERAGVISIISILDRIESHIEYRNPLNYDSVWYYVEDEKILGFLLEKEDAVEYIGVLPGHMGNGIGTELILEWFESKDLDKIPVRGWFEDVEGFYDDLPVEVENIR